MLDHMVSLWLGWPCVTPPGVKWSVVDVTVSAKPSCIPDIPLHRPFNEYKRKGTLRCKMTWSQLFTTSSVGLKSTAQLHSWSILHQHLAHFYPHLFKVKKYYRYFRSGTCQNIIKVFNWADLGCAAISSKKIQQKLSLLYMIGQQLPHSICRIHSQTFRWPLWCREIV